MGTTKIDCEKEEQNLIGNVWKQKENCCGCGSCSVACNYFAITMEEDSEGFSYPRIDREKCVGCGRCEKVCPVASASITKKEKTDKIYAYAIRTKNRDVLKTSTSGGVSYELGKSVLLNGGVVFGACFDIKFEVKHREIRRIEDLKQMQGSKYVQSDITDVYFGVEYYLKQGKEVLFTGTPCQVNGLYAYLGKPYERLYMQDLICHGVPSPRIWQRYVNEEKWKKSHESDNIIFRDKTKSWEQSQFCVIQNGAIKREPFHENLFYQAFARNYSLRPICYACPFKDRERESDLSCADLWGINEILPQYLNDDKGMSLVLVYSSKGMNLIERLKENCEVYEVPFEKAIAYNGMFAQSVKRPEEREKFFNDMNSGNVKRVLKKYRVRESIVLRVKKKLYPIKQCIIEKMKT